MGKFYSVYESGTDKPIAIHATSDECAAALGITRDSFYSKIARHRNGKKPMKYEIFEDGGECGWNDQHLSVFRCSSGSTEVDNCRFENASGEANNLLVAEGTGTAIHLSNVELDEHNNQIKCVQGNKKK